jgi:hypothetical protein
MDTTLTPVYVYGFEPDELENWQSDYGLRPMKLEPGVFGMLSEETPVVAHARAATEITYAFETEGILSDIILYLPPGSSAPTGAYYEAAVSEGELPGLASMLGHPQQFRMQRLAEDVPLSLLARPVQTLDLQSLGLPEADAVHLRTCPTCPSILREALRERASLYQRLSCPGIDELIAYASGNPALGGRLAAHIQACPFCNPQVEELRAVMVPSTVSTALAGPSVPREEMAGAGHDGRKVLIRVPTTTRLGAGSSNPPSRPNRELEELRNGLKAAFGAVFDLFDGARQGIGGWQIAGARGFKDPGRQGLTTDDELEFLPILQEVHDERVPVILSRGRESLYLGWDAEEHLPYLELPGTSSGRSREFSLEVRSAQTGDLVWSARSQGGKLAVRPEVVESELRRHEARRASQGAGGDAEYHMVILEEN